MITHTADHQFGDGVECELTGLASQNIRHSAQDIRRGHSREVIVKGEQSNSLGGFGIWIEQVIAELPHSLSRGNDVVIGKSSFLQNLHKGLLHMLVIAGVEEKLQIALLHERDQRLHKLDNEGTLCSGTTDGDENTTRLALASLSVKSRQGSVHSALTVVGDVLNQIAGNPVAGKLKILRLDAHPKEGLIVDRSLNKVETLRHNHKKLSVIVNNEIDDVGETTRNGGKSNERMGGNDGGIGGHTLEERTELNGH
mmetsp:Transcript_32960/g.97277  ORF Transcript_32960/g.97277 Transcript_32960/m.97277 type:complete len:254 (-) Transcript_32960:749-1510(-)